VVLFTSILNSRLKFFANDLNIISENQAGFRKGYSTVDNIFVLHALIDLYFSFGKKLYCTFVDFKKFLTQFGEQGYGGNYKIVK
jgi:hypothetical protein